jgi:hypothetical protein
MRKPNGSSRTRSLPPKATSQARGGSTHMDIKITFQKIEVIHVNANTTGTDDWEDAT